MKKSELKQLIREMVESLPVTVDEGGGAPKPAPSERSKESSRVRDFLMKFLKREQLEDMDKDAVLRTVNLLKLAEENLGPINTRTPANWNPHSMDEGEEEKLGAGSDSDLEDRYNQSRDTKHCSVCHKPFTPSYGEYKRCQKCVAKQHSYGEKSSGTQ